MLTPSYTQSFSTPEETFYEDAEGRFTLSRTLHYVGGEWRTHLHTTIHRWAPSTLKEIDRIYDRERARLPAVIGAMPARPSKTFDHFVRRYGWIKVADVPCHDGIRPFFIHMR